MCCFLENRMMGKMFQIRWALYWIDMMCDMRHDAILLQQFPNAFTMWPINSCTKFFHTPILSPSLSHSLYICCSPCRWTIFSITSISLHIFSISFHVAPTTSSFQLLFFKTHRFLWLPLYWTIHCYTDSFLPLVT